MGVLERPVERRTGNESGPRDQCDDGSFATGREPGVDEIVLSFSRCFGGKKRTLFCGHDLQRKLKDCAVSEKRGDYRKTNDSAGKAGVMPGSCWKVLCPHDRENLSAG